MGTEMARPQGESRSLASGIYGAVLATALVAAYSEDPSTEAGWVALAVAVTALVFWLVHGYATVLAGGVHHGRRLDWAAARVALRQEAPMLLAAIPVIAPLLLAPLGVLSTTHAEDLALAAGVGSLALAGALAGRRRGAGPLAIAAMALATGAVGGVMIALKAVVH
jgi:hypothetical protein